MHAFSADAETFRTSLQPDRAFYAEIIIAVVPNLGVNYPRGVTRRFSGGNEDREKKKKFTVGNAIF